MSTSLLPKFEQLLTYVGPERRRHAQSLPRLLLAVLDEVDHGLLVVSPDGGVLYANHAARKELAEPGAPLRLQGQRLVAADADEQAALHATLATAGARQLRSLVTLQARGGPCTASVVPLPAVPGRPGLAALLVKLGRREMVQALSLQAFAQVHGLTGREQDILSALCGGERPTEIAARMGLALSTVRTHIHNLRRKAGAADVMSLVRMAAALPPMVGALRSA